jgi:hypothetical protein
MCTNAWFVFITQYIALSIMYRLLVARIWKLQKSSTTKKKAAYAVYCQDAKMLTAYEPTDSTNKYNDTKSKNIKQMT